jgi:hypothetical protein
VNQIRAQSMYRVQMHQELSPVFMRMPHEQRDLKPTVQEDDVGKRLDRMVRALPHRGKDVLSYNLRPSCLQS